MDQAVEGVPADLTSGTVDLTANVIRVPVGQESFEFRLPSPRDSARMGARAQVMRRTDAPETNGSEIGLDGWSTDLYRAFALFECLLVRADTEGNWIWNEGPDKSPNNTKFKADQTIKIVQAYRGFQTALDTFFFGGPGDVEPVRKETLDGGGTPAPVAIQP